jgi:hypothetical protein
VLRDPTTVGDQRGLLLGNLPPCQQPVSFNVGEILPAYNSSVTVNALRPAILSAIGSAPLVTSPRMRRASCGAAPGIHGEPCSPMVWVRFLPAVVRCVTMQETTELACRRAANPLTEPSQMV